MTEGRPRPAFSGCAYLRDVTDREVSAAVPLRIEQTDRGWELALIDDGGNEMVFDAREGRLRCDRFALTMEGRDPPVS